MDSVQRSPARRDARVGDAIDSITNYPENCPRAMTFLPIVARELRVAARRRGTFWTRAIVATLAIASGTFLYLANIEAPPQNIGQRIFFGLMVLAMFFCLFAGRQSTADCLSEEKRQGTLGLLFLTDLKGY